MLASLLRWSFVFSVMAAASAFAVEPGPSYKSLERASAVTASPTGTQEAAAAQARAQFDEPIDPTIFSPLERPKGAPPVPTLKPAADFVVGRPQRLREPKNPLNEKNEPKKSGGGWGMKLLGGLIGGLLCGALGFFLGGPVGAAVGFAAGALGGWMVTK